MKYFVLCIVAIAGLSQVINAAYDGDSCFTDDGAGTCRQLARCESLLRLVQQGINRALRVHLQKLACGFEGSHPLVCCTDKNVPAPSAPTTSNTPIDSRRPSTTEANPFQSEATEGASAEPQPPDVRGHPNLRLLNQNCGTIEQGDRIVGGNRTMLFEMPWMVLIAYESARGYRLSCGGTLITSRYVLTAAHCVTELGPRLALAGVVLGEYDVRTNPDCERVEGKQFCAPSARNVSIESVTAHPGYSTTKYNNDIALIRLAEPADFSLDSMKPICLPTISSLQRESLVGRKGVVAGWGTTEDGLQSPVLLSVALPIISNADCQALYNSNLRIWPQQMCAGGEQDRDSCGGDSGGPLMFPGHVNGAAIASLRYVQRGIVSYGSKRCGVGQYPGVYTRVAYYMDWILDNIRE